MCGEEGVDGYNLEVEMDFCLESVVDGDKIENDDDEAKYKLGDTNCSLIFQKEIGLGEAGGGFECIGARIKTSCPVMHEDSELMEKLVEDQEKAKMVRDRFMDLSNDEKAEQMRETIRETFVGMSETQSGIIDECFKALQGVEFDVIENDPE